MLVKLRSVLTKRSANVSVTCHQSPVTFTNSASAFKSSASLSGSRLFHASTDTFGLFSGSSGEVTTNNEGNFSIGSVEPGVYQVAIEQANFKKRVRDRVEVADNTTVRADVTLEAGVVSEIVQITGDPVVLKTNRDKSPPEAIAVVPKRKNQKRTILTFHQSTAITARTRKNAWRAGDQGSGGTCIESGRPAPQGVSGMAG